MAFQKRNILKLIDNYFRKADILTIIYINSENSEKFHIFAQMQQIITLLIQMRLNYSANV